MCPRDDGLAGRCVLGGGEGDQLGGQCLNLALDGGGVDAGMGVVEDCSVLGADPLVSEAR
ncbi:hypothetical protein CA951_03610 [Rhodococcus sp. NCIMB 12038]|nr:hypothetical protein CA951_03610 [Rhodococcus sp. NCIMB 12038]